MKKDFVAGTVYCLFLIEHFAMIFYLIMPIAFSILA